MFSGGFRLATVLAASLILLFSAPTCNQILAATSLSSVLFTNLNAQYFLLSLGGNPTNMVTLTYQRAGTNLASINPTIGRVPYKGSATDLADTAIEYVDANTVSVPEMDLDSMVVTNLTNGGPVISYASGVVTNLPHGTGAVTNDGTGNMGYYDYSTGKAANWVGSSTTNSTLVGTATVHGLAINSILAGADTNVIHIDSLIPTAVDTSTTDCYQYFTNASSIGSTIILGARTYYLSTNLTPASSTHLVGQGSDKTRILLGPTAGYAIRLTNTLLAPALALSGNQSEGATNLVMGTTAGIVTNSWYLISDSLSEVVGKTHSELVFVISTNATLVFIRSPLCRTYLSANSPSLSRTSGSNFSLSGLALVATNSCTNGIYICYVGDLRIKDIKLTGFDYMGMFASSCSGTIVQRLNIYGTGKNLNRNYGLSFDTSTYTGMYDYYTELTQDSMIAYCINTVIDGAVGVNCLTVLGTHAAMSKNTVIMNGFSYYCGNAWKVQGTSDTNTVFENIHAFFGNQNQFDIGGTGTKILNCSVSGSTGPAMRCMTATNLLVDGFSITGLTTPSYGITVNGLSGTNLFRNISYPDGQLQLFQAAGAVTGSIQCDSIVSRRGIWQDSGNAVSSFSATQVRCYSSKNDCAVSSTTNFNASGLWLANSLQNGIVGYDDQGTSIQSPLDWFANYGAYNPLIGPGYGAGKTLRFSGFSALAQGVVKINLAHGVKWLSPGQRMTIILGDTSPTLNVQLIENGTTIYTFGPGSPVNSRVDLMYLGSASTWVVTGWAPSNMTVGGGTNLNDWQDFYLVNVDSQTMTNHTAVGYAGWTHTLKLISPATTCILTNAVGAQLIDGATSYSLTASNKFVTVRSDGTNWWVIGNN